MQQQQHDDEEQHPQQQREEEDQSHDDEDHEEGAAAPSEPAAKQRRLPGFSMPPSITVWSDPMAPVVLADYLRLQGLTLKLAQSPPVEEWTAHTKPAITCNHCKVTNSSTSITFLQQGGGNPCLCSGQGSVKERWYYERAIAQPFEDRDGRVWYAKLHDGRLAKPSWEDWLAAAEHGNQGKLQLTCLHCGVTTSSTGISDLQRGRGISCLCCPAKGSLTQRWYYDRVIAQPFADRDGRVRYAKLHDGSLTKPSWEEWLAAAEHGHKGKLRLMCLHCGVTTSTTTSISALQQGHGISCVCSPAKGSLTQRWYYDRAIAQPFEDRNGRVWYAKLHDGRLAKPSWEDWRAAAEHGHKGKLRLMCLHCGVTTSTTRISDLQRGRGASCICRF
jgi:hypothetical protein